MRTSLRRPIAAALVALATWTFLGLPAGAQTSAPAATHRTAPALPREPGFHDLFYAARLNDHDRKVAYTVFLPEGYDGKCRWPMVVYLCGVGERGENHEGLYFSGPPMALKTDKALGHWAPFVVLAPQCPPDLRWDSPGMSRYVLDLIDLARRTWAIDDSRIYLTGFSMGGSGVWRVALESQGLFAVVNPFCALEVAADKIPAAVQGATVWIICGGADRMYTEGSRRMFNVLRDAKADVVYTEVPDQSHRVWPDFYASKQFYEFLLLHCRGHKAPTSRPVQEQLLAISYTRPNSADAQLVEPFKRFLPWWYVTDCGRQNSPGLKDEWMGRKNVFVTMPLDGALPCRLLTTAEIPPGKKTSLDLVVAAHPKGQWELVVRANGNDLFKRSIGGGPMSASAPGQQANPWTQVKVNLSRLAGQDVYLEVINRATDSAHPEAYWGKVTLTSEDLGFEKFLSGWTLTDCGLTGDPGLREDARSRKNVFVTNPAGQATPCRMTTTLAVPEGKVSALRLVVGRHEHGAWELIVRANGEELLRQTVGPNGGEDTEGWREFHVDLSRFGGRKILVEILHVSAGTPNDDAYWAGVELVSTEKFSPKRAAVWAGGLAGACLLLYGLRRLRRKRSTSSPPL